MNALKEMTSRYGPPQEKTPHVATWYYNSPWKRSAVYRDTVPHKFPQPHLDVLAQTVEYFVPVEKVQELAEFDGSIVVDRTTGELTAHCSTEEMNRALLNLAHDIVVGKRTPLEAREVLAEIFGSLRLHWPEEYATALHFTNFDPSYGRQDPDVKMK